MYIYACSVIICIVSEAVMSSQKVLSDLNTNKEAKKANSGHQAIG